MNFDIISSLMQSFVACSYLCENNKTVYSYGKKRRSRILYSAKQMSEPGRSAWIWVKAALMSVVVYEATRIGHWFPPALLTLSEGTSHESNQGAFFLLETGDCRQPKWRESQ